MKNKIFTLLLCCACCLTASAQVADKKTPLDSLDFHGLLVAMCDMKNETLNSVNVTAEVANGLASLYYEVNGNSIAPEDLKVLVGMYAEGQLKQDMAGACSDIYLRAFGNDKQAFQTAVAGMYKKEGIVLRALDKGFVQLLGRIPFIVAAAPDAGQAINLANDLMVQEGEGVPGEFYQAFRKFYEQAGYPAFIEEYLLAQAGGDKALREKYAKVAAYLKEASVDYFACRLYNNSTPVNLLRMENPAVPLHGKLLHCYYAFLGQKGKHLARSLVPDFQKWAYGQGVHLRWVVRDLSELDEPGGFPGGESALRAYVQKNLTYPPQAREQGVEGKVLVRYKVLEDGSIGEVCVEESSDSPALDEEAVRVVKSFPRFLPARHQGIAMSYWRYQSFSFSLRDVSIKGIKVSNSPGRVRNAIKESQRNMDMKSQKPSGQEK